jgi:recombination protein RecA
MGKDPKDAKDDPREKARQAAVDLIHKQYGKGAIQQLGDAPVQVVDCYSTGSLMLDDALGVGGYPRGRVIEVFGPESGGKTTMTLHAIAEAQKKGGSCAFIDAEHALDLNYARNLGVNTDDLYLAQPDHGEQALEILDILVSSGGFDLAVVDSVAALVPRAEIEGDMGDSHMGLQARLMSQALRKLTGFIGKTRTTVIFINQLRQKIGVMFGNPETTTGGNALKFYSSVRLDIRRISSLKKGDDNFGNTVRIKVVKNKLAPPFTQVEIDLIFGRGFDPYREVLDCAVAFDLVEKKGAWYQYGAKALGQGKENAVLELQNNESRYNTLRTAVLAHLEEKKAARVIPAGKPKPTQPALPGEEKIPQAPEPNTETDKEKKGKKGKK